MKVKPLKTVYKLDAKEHGITYGYYDAILRDFIYLPVHEVLFQACEGDDKGSYSDRSYYVCYGDENGERIGGDWCVLLSQLDAYAFLFGYNCFDEFTKEEVATPQLIEFIIHFFEMDDGLEG